MAWKFFTSSGQEKQSLVSTVELDYVERTTNITINGVAEGAATTILTSNAITVDGNTPIIVEFFAPEVAFGGAGVTAGINLWMDGADLGRLFDGSAVNNIVANYPVGKLTRRLTPASGSRTFSIRGWCGAVNMVVQAGVGGAGVALPMFTRISRAR